MNKKVLVDVIGMLLIALVVIVGYKLSPLLLPKVDVNIAPEPGCDLNHAACAAKLPNGGRLVLRLAPQPIPVVAPMQVEVRLEGVQAQQVEIDLAGVDMNMGFNRPLLTSRGEGLFVGQATLPVCITGGMEWQASVLVDTGRESIAVPFRFTTGAH